MANLLSTTLPSSEFRRDLQFRKLFLYQPANVEFHQSLLILNSSNWISKSSILFWKIYQLERASNSPGSLPLYKHLTTIFVSNQFDLLEDGKKN